MNIILENNNPIKRTSNSSFFIKNAKVSHKKRNLMYKKSENFNTKDGEVL